MPNRIERFTQRARRILSLAQQEAENAHHLTIEPEHILIAMYREEGNIGGNILREMGFDEKKIRALAEPWLRNISRTHPLSSAQKEISLSDGVKRILENAVDEARQRGHHYIGSEHLLLGYVRLRDKDTLAVYRDMGMTLAEIGRRVSTALKNAAEMKEPMVTLVSNVDTETLASAVQIIRDGEMSPTETVVIDLHKLLGNIRVIHDFNIDQAKQTITVVVEHEPETKEDPPPTSA